METMSIFSRAFRVEQRIYMRRLLHCDVDQAVDRTQTYVQIQNNVATKQQHQHIFLK